MAEDKRHMPGRLPIRGPEDFGYRAGGEARAPARAAQSADAPAEKPLPDDSAARKQVPMATGCLDYFPDALAYVASVSYGGNEKHNPGQPLHWSRGKSMDHADCIMRHLAQRGGFDNGVRHSGALAWRALALLQEELEAAHGLPMPRGARDATAAVKNKGPDSADMM